MDKPLVLLEVADQIAVLTLNHPEKRNALSQAMLAQLLEHFRSVAVAQSVRVVILRAAGPAFSAGHDLRELVGGQERQYQDLFALCTEVMEAIRKLPQPVIAQVQGVATAAGCQLAATCDLVVAAEDASFATPGVKIGLFCSTPAVALARAVPPKKAMEMLLTGNPISAREGERIGLVSRVVPSDRLADETMDLARQISTASSYTIALGKRTFYEQLHLGRPEAYEVACRAMVENAQAADAEEGIRAFLEKRPPKWSGR
ncbi:MAG TPA: enoyl-CoA hydratase [Gemmataceae bacterium]|jgi:enoyl-CoA hydratase/carnithine racemase|nr:enoyl-CoA hydratase [Gemmataceae bacterium]